MTHQTHDEMRKEIANEVTQKIRGSYKGGDGVPKTVRVDVANAIDITSMTWLSKMKAREQYLVGQIEKMIKHLDRVIGMTAPIEELTHQERELHFAHVGQKEILGLVLSLINPQESKK